MCIHIVRYTRAMLTNNSAECDDDTHTLHMSRQRRTVIQFRGLISTPWVMRKTSMFSYGNTHKHACIYFTFKSLDIGMDWPTSFDSFLALALALALACAFVVAIKYTWPPSIHIRRACAENCGVCVSPPATPFRPHGTSPVWTCRARTWHQSTTTVNQSYTLAVDGVAWYVCTSIGSTHRLRVDPPQLAHRTLFICASYVRCDDDDTDVRAHQHRYVEQLVRQQHLSFLSGWAATRITHINILYCKYDSRTANGFAECITDSSMLWRSVRKVCRMNDQSNEYIYMFNFYMSSINCCEWSPLEVATNSSVMRTWKYST